MDFRILWAQVSKIRWILYYDPEIGTKFMEVSKLRYILYHGLEFASECLICWTRICHKSGKEKMTYLEFGQRHAFGKELTHVYETTHAYEPLILQRLTNE